MMKEYNFISKPKVLQFEISSMCNAQCLGCVRTDNTTFNSSKTIIPQGIYLSIDIISKILSDDTMNEVYKIIFCGNIDDPIMHPKLIEILEKIKKFENIKVVYLFTNGSAKSNIFWKRLANILTKFDKHQVRFSIDGIENIHEFYRQKTSFEKIINNAKTFIKYGGNARWQYIIFPWNKEYIEKAYHISKSIGFQEFVTRQDKASMGCIYNSSGELSLSNIKRFKPKNIITEKEFIKKYNTKKSCINCHTRKDKSLFISHDARLWPCSFIPDGFFNYNKNIRDFLHKRIYKNYGKDFNLLTQKSIKEILTSSFFSSDLVKSWDNDVSIIKQGKIVRCVDKCSVINQRKKPIGVINIKEINEKNI